MAQESIITKLGAKPLGYQVGVLVGTMVVLGGLYYQFFYSTLSDDLKAAKSGYARLEKKQTSLKADEKEWAQMVKDKEALDLQLSTNQVSLPETADLASFIGQMQRQAAVAGVSFKNWSRQKEETLTGYVKVPISIEVVGNFHQILKYFYLLGKTKRIITVENFTLMHESSKEAINDDFLLKATFQASTFRQPDREAEPEATAEVKSGMINKAKDARAKKEAQVEAVTGKTDEKGNPVPDDKAGTDRLKSPGAQ